MPGLLRISLSATATWSEPIIRENSKWGQVLFLVKKFLGAGYESESIYTVTGLVVIYLVLENDLKKRKKINRQ